MQTHDRASSPFLRKAFSVGVVSLLAALAILGFVTPVHAAFFDSQCNANTNSANSLSCGALANVTTGDVIVVVVEAYGATNCPTLTDGMVTGTSGFTLAVSACSVGVNIGRLITAIWTTTATGSGAVTPVITIENGIAYYIEGYAVTGPSAVGLATSKDSLIPNQCSACTSLSDSVNSFTLLSGITFTANLAALDTVGNPVFTAPTGFATYGCAQNGRQNACSTFSFATFGSSTLANSYTFASQLAGASMVAVSLGATVQGSQVQTIGSCPTKNTATFTLVNSTIYMYQGTTVGPQSVNAISTFVASTIGSGPHTLRLLIYAQQVVGFPSATVSAGFPLIKQYEKSFVLTSGTTNTVVSAQTAVSIGGLFAFGTFSSDVWAVGIVGDDHIKINQSSLSGLVTQTGVASTLTQPNTFTSAGTANGNKIYLCSTAVYQSIVFVTSTLTTTTTPSTTVTTTATTYNIAITSQGVANWSIVFLLVILPGFLLAVGSGVATKSPQIAGVGLISGMTLGAGIGAQPQVALVPPSLFFALVVVDIFIMIGLWRFGGGTGTSV
jgi:hypothetical protein